MSQVKVVIEQPTVNVIVEDDGVNVYQYTGTPIYPTIFATPPITYNAGTYTIGINQSSLNINQSQVTGLGSAATRNVPTSGDAASNEVVLGNDSRLTASSSHMPFGIVTDVPGHYLVSMGSGVVNQILPSGRPFFTPIWLSDSAALDRIVVEVASSASEFGVVRLGIYAPNSKGLPGTRIVDAGTVNGSIVGVKQAVINQNLSGLIWLCVLAQNGNVSLKCFTNTIQAYPSPTTGAVSAGKLALSYDTPFFGALPANLTTPPVGSTYYPPLVNLRLA